MAYIENGYIEAGYFEGGFSLPALDRVKVRLFIVSTEGFDVGSISSNLAENEVGVVFSPFDKKIFISTTNGYAEFSGGSIDIDTLKRILVSDSTFVTSVGSSVLGNLTVKAELPDGTVVADCAVVEDGGNRFIVQIPDSIKNEDYQLVFSLDN